MDGRFFAGTRVEAYIADGSERFRKANERLAALESDDEEESKRLDEFGSWLESESIIKDASK
jgi:HIV Tat-specific factor 1